MMAVAFLCVHFPALARDSAVVFNEVHYHPENDEFQLEYVELYNQLAVDVDLSNWRIDGDIDFDFPEGTVLGAGQYLVVAKNPGALENATGFNDALGPYTRDLSNSGDPVRLYNNNLSFRSNAGGVDFAGVATSELEGRRVMDELYYKDTYPWPLGPDGSGFSLAKQDPFLGTEHPESWRASTQINGTPGSVNTFTSLPSVVFNEVDSVTSLNFQVELYNSGSSPIDLDGFLIGSSDPLHPDYTFIDESLAAGEFLVIDAVTLGYTPADNNRLFLYTADKAMLVDTVRVDDRAFARSPDGAGAWAIPDAATFGAVNSFSFDDRIVINEIFYHAYPQRAEPGTASNEEEVLVLDYDAVWRYNLDAGVAGLSTGWASDAHVADNVSWATGQGLLGVESATLDEPILTNITKTAQITYYFETEFDYTDLEAVAEMTIDHYIDDGAIFYLNGVEIGRFNMADGAVSPTTAASSAIVDAAKQTLFISNPSVLNGTNRLSVEVHQRTSGSSDIVFGAQVRLLRSDGTGTPATPFVERTEEWVELYNRSAESVDLTGWKINGGIDYKFPDLTTLPAGGYLVVAKDSAALAAKHPSATIIGDYSNKLGNGGDFFWLEDASGNIADEVRYYDSGKWHAAADGGGSSLELRDPDSDNAVAEAWAASDETTRSSWQTYTYEAVAVDDNMGPSYYHEFLIALLESGEFLLDDVSVIENDSVEFIQNGTFESDAVGSPADKWRAIGTHGSHGRTIVVTDPEDGGNQCLHVVSTGPTEDKHNKLETTFANGEQVVVGNTYRIQFRAKWLSGSNQVNTRLYFNYLQRTTNIEVPEIWGTPGAANSMAVENAGPSLENLSHSPVIPNSGQAVTVTVDAADLDGVDDVTLFYSVNDGAFQSSLMSSSATGNYTGSIPGQSASDTIRFYVRGRDSLDALSYFPAAAEQGGAFYKVQDGLADTSGLRHNFRIIMAESDRAFLFLNTNIMSNDRVPATVIEDESRVYYDVGLRLKASPYGRSNSDKYGYSIRFQPDHLYRGVFETLSIERSADRQEMPSKHMLNRAGGGYWSFYDDVAHIINPNAGDSGIGVLSMARQSSRFWEGLFPDEDEEGGPLFNHELLYSPKTTTGGAEDLKIGFPTDLGKYDLEDRGDDKESYRWVMQIRSDRDRDDYERVIALNQAMGNYSGAALKEALDPIIDVNQWMRSFAMISLLGINDVYGRSTLAHNVRYYVRPSDQKILLMLWDLDNAYRISTSSVLAPPQNNVAKLFSIPEYRRMFDGHIEDIIQTAYNTTYMTPWMTHFSTVAGSGDYSSYIANRGTYALSALPDPVTFEITTNGGADFSEEDSAVTLSGNGWIDVFSITVNGVEMPVTWTDAESWTMDVPISIGANLLTLAALNHRGVEVGDDTITVTNTSAVDLASADNTIISELHYHPADPTANESVQGFTDADDFEFVELLNIGGFDIDLTNVRFSNGIDYLFPSGTYMAPGERVIAVANQAAFEYRYGTNAATIAGEYSGKFNNGGERVRLDAADGTAIADFTYGDDLPWPPSADGDGYSLIYTRTDPSNALHWRTSTGINGNPGNTDTIPFDGGDLLSYVLTDLPTVEIVTNAFMMHVPINLAADDALYQFSFSTDLVDWTVATDPLDITSRINNGDGTATFIIQAPLSVSEAPKQFGKVSVELEE